MPPETETVSVECDRDAAAALVRHLATLGAPARLSERHNLDGTAVALAWVFATVTVKSLPHLLDFIATMIIDTKVKSMKVGDIEVQNPGPEELRALHAALARRFSPDA